VATCQIFAMARQRLADSCPTRCVASVVPGTPSTAICSGLPVHRGRAHPLAIMGTKSRETIYGASVRAAAERELTFPNDTPKRAETR